MFNFDCEVKTKNYTYVIKNNMVSVLELINSLENKLYTVKDTNKLITTYYEVIKKATVKAMSYLNSLDHKTLIEELAYLVSARELLINLKGKICQENYRRGKTSLLDKFKSEVTGYFRGILSTVKTKKFSYPEKMIVGYFVGHFEGEFDTYSISEYYDPSKDKILIEKEHEAVLNFDYSPYPQILKEREENSVNFIVSLAKTSPEMIAKFNEVYDVLLSNIEAYKTIISAAGESIVNWSSVKTSRFINKNNLKDMSWGARGWISTYVEQLIKQGVKPQEQKISKAQKAELKVKEGKGKIDQEDLIRVFKQGSSDTTCATIEKLNLKSMQELISTDLKCVTERFENNYVIENLVKRYCTLSETKEDYKTLVNFLNKYSASKEEPFSYRRSYEGAWKSATWNFMVKNQDYITIEEMISFGKTRSNWNDKAYDAPESFFDKVLTKIPTDKILSMNQEISYEYLKRMDAKELLNILPELNEINVNLEKVVKLYAKVKYSSLKQVMISNKKFLSNAASLIAENKDKEFAENCLRDSMKGNDDNSQKRLQLDNDTKEILFNLLSYEKKVEIIFSDVKKSSNNVNIYGGYSVREACFTYDLEKIFNTTELLSFMYALLKELKKYAGREYMAKACELYKERKASIKNFNDMLMTSSDCSLSLFPLNEEIVELLSNSSKVNLLRTHNIFLTQPIKETSIIGDFRVNFFKTLKRNDVIEGLGNDLLNFREIFFIAHVLTDAEKITAANRSNEFLRVNLKYISLDYLKKFKDKETFKTCVGDQRNPYNRSFAQALSERIGVSVL